MAHQSGSRRPATAAFIHHRNPPRPPSRHPRAHPAPQLRRRRGQRQPDQDDQTPDVRPGRLRPAPQARPPGPPAAEEITACHPITEFAPEPVICTVSPPQAPCKSPCCCCF
jgi:hypothetical protein